MAICYVTISGSSVSFDEGYVVITEKKGMIREIPAQTLESLVILGNVHITTPCIQELLKRKIPVSFFSKRGNYYGRLSSTSSTSAARIKKQVDLSRDPPFCLALSKRLIEAKVNNQIVVLSRYSKGDCKDILNKMRVYRHYINGCKSENELMGYEGMAAREYFDGISSIINKEFYFKGRSRQPPRDPFNSMISFGYTLLMYEIFGIIENRNLSPYIGFFHKDHEKHPTLASDLLEEWRAPIVDSVVLSILQQGKLTKEDFYKNEENGGILLTDKALKTYTLELEKKMATPHKYLDYLKDNVNFRRSIYHQVLSLIKAIECEDPALYFPIRIR